jgi:hypothetical protein
VTYPERTEEREGETDKIVADEQRWRYPSPTTTAMMESPSGVRVDLHRSAGAVGATRFCHLGGAVAGCSLLRRLHRQSSSVAVSGGKTLGLLAGIGIPLDERFGIHADPQCSGNDDGDGDDNNKDDYDNEDDYDYTMVDLLSLAASFGDGVVADAQIPADISWRFRTECV